LTIIKNLLRFILREGIYIYLDKILAFIPSTQQNKNFVAFTDNMCYNIIIKCFGGAFMQRFHDCPQILRDFLVYHETIMGQSQLTISEYHLDLRMFLRFMKLMRNDMPIHTNLDDIPIKDIDIDFIRSITTSEIFDFLSYLSNDRTADPDAAVPTYGIAPAARARKLSALKSFYKYLTVRTKQLTENPVADLEYPKLRKSLPKYLTMEQSAALLQAVSGPNAKRDYAILMLFLNCGIRRSELVGLNLSDVYEDRIRVVGKGNKERIVYFGTPCRKAIDAYLVERNKKILSDNRALFGSRNGNRISVEAVHRLVKKSLLAAGLDATQFSAHKLRHTAATMMLSGGVDVKTVQEVLGHENLNTTQIYTHIESTELKIAAQANPLSKLDFTVDVDEEE
jgi:site-specific recombinase XerD